MKNLGSYFKTVGFYSLLLLGLGMMFGVFAYYIDFGYAVTSGSKPAAVWAFLGLGVLVVTILLIVSVLVILTGLREREGILSQMTIFMILMLVALAFILNGAGMLSLYSTCNSYCSYYGYGSILDSGVISLIGGVVLFIASLLSRALTIQAKITGSIFALAFGILSTTQVYYNTYFPSLISYNSFVSLFQDVSGIFNPLGILNWSYFTGVAFIIGAVGFLLYSIMMKTRAVGITYIIILLGALIFSVGLVWDSLSQVTANGFWSFVSSTPVQGIIPAITEIVFVFAGFLLLAASALGVAIQGQSLASLMMIAPTVGTPSTPASATQPVMGAGQFCPACGAQNAPENAYCRKCGAKLG
jgi:hypothetical protein